MKANKDDNSLDIGERTPSHLDETTFPVGTIVVTQRAMAALELDGTGTFLAFLLRHAARFNCPSGNRKTVRARHAAVSRFDLATGETLLVMVEADQQITTVIMMDED